jgi:tRNA pseudouridine38-40 synthase
MQREFTPAKLRAAINGNLDPDVRVLEALVVPDEFHARYSAREKTYVYRIINAAVLSPFWTRYALQEARPLDLARMARAASFFLGEHDWTAFSAAQTDVESRVRTITNLEIAEHLDERAQARLIEIRISAEGFLRYMVRSIAGTLLAVGRGEMDEDVVCLAIAGGDRSIVAATAPAKGLTLLSVRYDRTL